MTNQAGFQIDAAEKRKRLREKILAAVLGLVFLILTWIEFRLFGMSESLPFQHSIFFFGLVNFNIILFLLMMFLIFRNVVKNFAEREGGPLGSSLKSKLIAAFVGFTFVPTAIMFTISVFYINNSFDRWFNEKMSGVLRSSIEVTNSYYLAAKKKNYHYAAEIAQYLPKVETRTELRKLLAQLREKYAVDAVEFYPGIFGEREMAIAKSDGVPEVPEVSLEFRQKGIEDKNESSTIHHFAEGDLIRVIVPAKAFGSNGAVVVSSYIPLSLITRMDEIAAAYENFRDADPLVYPIKSIYLIILVLMTLVVLFGATWFGFYLARQLSIPLEELQAATQRVVKGEYKQVQISSGTPEINRLIDNFNIMTEHLGRSVAQLDEHSRYISVVLSQVTTGVISVNKENVITMVNQHAEKLLEIDAEQFVGKDAKTVFSPEYYATFSEIMAQMKAHKATTVKKEIQITVKGKPLLLQMTVSMLHDEEGNELGKVLVFDDLSLVLAAQRSAAWTEVARRIAHEIKNPLTPISLAAQRLQRKFGETIKDPAFEECTKMIVNQVDDLKHLVNEFSQFARMPKTKPVLGSLNRTINEAVKLFEPNDNQYTLTFVTDSSLPDFLFDPDQIKRVITNLMDNAVESVRQSPNGQIKVETAYDPTLRIVRIIVSDNGVGIPPYLRGRIFEPYVTTKTHGTGLGLAIVKRAVEDHNGYVRALDNEPQGTRFVIELPVIVSNTATTIGANV